MKQINTDLVFDTNSGNWSRAYNPDDPMGSPEHELPLGHVLCGIVEALLSSDHDELIAFLIEWGYTQSPSRPELWSCGSAYNPESMLWNLEPSETLREYIETASYHDDADALWAYGFEIIDTDNL